MMTDDTTTSSGGGGGGGGQFSSADLFTQAALLNDLTSTTPLLPTSKSLAGLGAMGKLFFFLRASNYALGKAILPETSLYNA